MCLLSDFSRNPGKTDLTCQCNIPVNAMYSYMCVCMYVCVYVCVCVCVCVCVWVCVSTAFSYCVVANVVFVFLNFPSFFF